MMSSNVTLEEFDGLSLNILFEGKRVGFIDAFEAKNADHGVWVEYVYILPRYRENGIGTRAVKMAISRWRRMGYRRVSLDDVHWDKPYDFWGKLGFHGEGKRKSLEIADAPYVARP